ncbi:MAG: DNA-processing protein DprA [Bacteriovoracia bacterium]
MVNFSAKLSEIKSVSLGDLNYPNILLNLKRPPKKLFYIGALPNPEIVTLGVVGCRTPTSYGVDLIKTIVPNLKTRPLQIVSGLAHGVDGLAHSYACQVNIPNFAILGHGLDQIYPTQHERLASIIVAKGGGLLSEFPPGTKPATFHFPLRNRIIGAFSDCVWVPQASLRSGSRYTIDTALELGKQVCTTPGDIFSEYHALPNEMLANGAGIVLNATDLDMYLTKKVLS